MTMSCDELKEVSTALGPPGSVHAGVLPPVWGKNETAEDPPFESDKWSGKGLHETLKKWK